MKKVDDGRRVQRVEREVQEIVSRFLMGTFKGDLPGIVTVTQVRMPPDLKAAKVYVSVLNTTVQADHEAAAEVLQERAYEMQKYLAANLSLRFTPKLQFLPDLSLEKVLKIDRILHDLSQGKRPAEDED